MQSVDAAGNEAAPVEPSEAVCDDCAIGADSIEFAGSRLVVFGLSTALGLSPGSVGAPSKVRAFALGANGELTPHALPNGVLGLPPFAVEGGVLVLVADRTIVPIDTSFEAIGPALPSPRMNTTAASLDLQGDSFIAYPGAVEASATAGHAEVLVQRYDRSGQLSAPVERLSTTTASVRAIARRDDRLLVMHGGAPRLLSLARIPNVGPPQKIGGDIVFDTVGSYDHRIIALAPDRFRAVSIEDSQIVAREVTCAP